MQRSNSALFWPVLGVVTASDFLTKLWADRTLDVSRNGVEVVGDYLRFTLVYNPGAAFGLHLGPYSRWIFMALTIGALVILWRLLKATRPGDWPRVLAVALVTAGAVGNLIDRIKSHQGVVDFLDVGIGDRRWPTFNVADMAVSGGAFLLAWVLWREERAAEEAERRAAMMRPPDLPPGAGTAPAPSGDPRDVA